MDPQKAMQKLKPLVDLMDGEKASAEETAQIFALVFAILEKIQGQNEENKATHSQTLDTTEKDLSKKIDDSYEKCKKLYDDFVKKEGGDIDSIRKELSQQVNRLEGMIPSETDLSGLEAKIEQVRSEIPEIQPIPDKDTAQEIRDRLETLKDDDRMDKSAIKGIEEIEEKVKKIELRPIGTAGGGARGIQLYVDGAKKGIINYLNLVAGTNVTLTYNRASGRNDITISATLAGGGSFSVLTATGAVDDSNVTFTFVSAPALVVVNGTAYRNGHGVAISGTTATLDSPAGVSGDVYAIG